MNTRVEVTRLPPHAAAWGALRRAIWLFDPVGLRGLYANAAALELWGASSLDELLARDFSGLSPAVRARTERLALSTRDGGEVSERWTFYPHGAPVTVQATISTYWLDARTPALLFEAAPAEFGASEVRAVEALRHTTTLITLFDQDGRPLFANPAAFAAYGAVDHPLADRFVDSAMAARIAARAAAGAITDEVCQVQTVQGAAWHHIDARPVLDPATGAPGILLNERDVTARIAAEQAKAAAEQKAAMAEARQKFLTDMSHELRTPLNAVIGFSELLCGAGLQAQHTEQARRVNDAGTRLLTVVNDMIRLSETEPLAAEVIPGDARGEREAQAASDRGDAPSRGILYVDDNESNRALVTAILASQGLSCMTANDGLEGLECARLGGWSLVLMDIQMPVMDGVAATRAIRALGGSAGDVPIVALTANTQAAELEVYTEAGMDDVIAKPVDMARLLASVLHWTGA